MNIALIGATGLVGRKIIDILNERKITADNFYLFATKKSAGLTFFINDKPYVVQELTKQALLSKKIDLAFFTAGSLISQKYIPILSDNWTIVIDNSSFYRLEENIPLVVPEVNDEDLLSNSNIIANPNCSTIQLMPVLKSLSVYGLKRVVVTTMQAVSGAGMQGQLDLENYNLPPKTFPVPIHSNCIPKIGNFTKDMYTEEENKIINESRKILHLKDLHITATCVRVPVYNCHCESVNMEFFNKFEINGLIDRLLNTKNLKVFLNEEYPTPLCCNNQDLVMVGRIRRDYSVENGVFLWIVADNLRKGAATNAVDIFESLKKIKKLI